GVAGLYEQPDARRCRFVRDSAACLDEPGDRAIGRSGIGFDVRLVGPSGGFDVRGQAGRQLPQRAAGAHRGSRSPAGVAAKILRLEALDLREHESTPPLVLGTTAET